MGGFKPGHPAESWAMPSLKISGGCLQNPFPVMELDGMRTDAYIAAEGAKVQHYRNYKTNRFWQFHYSVFRVCFVHFFSFPSSRLSEDCHSESLPVSYAKSQPSLPDAAETLWSRSVVGLWCSVAPDHGWLTETPLPIKWVEGEEKEGK